jgi:hypothetical protein
MTVIIDSENGISIRRTGIPLRERTDLRLLSRADDFIIQHETTV